MEEADERGHNGEIIRNGFKWKAAKGKHDGGMREK